MKFKSLLFAVLTFTANAKAEEYSNVSVVDDISVTNSLVRVRMENMKATSQCSGQNQQWYALDPNSPLFSEKYSALLAAKATKESVFVQILGCVENYGKIVVVYLCENTQCT